MMAVYGLFIMYKAPEATGKINWMGKRWENPWKIITGYFMGNIMEYGDETWRLKQFLGQ